MIRLKTASNPSSSDIEVDEREWNQGREHVGTVLKKELQDCEAALAGLEPAVGGRRKLKEVMAFVDKARKGDIVVEGDGRSGAGGFSAALLSKGQFPTPLICIGCS